MQQLPFAWEWDLQKLRPSEGAEQPQGCYSLEETTMRRRDIALGALQCSMRVRAYRIRRGASEGSTGTGRVIIRHACISASKEASKQ